VKKELRDKAELYYFILGGIFIASLVACNLIFQKFFFWTPFTFLDFGTEEGSAWHSITHYTFFISVGIIPYPITFLVTDIISEIYGRRRADMVVVTGFVVSVFVLLIIFISDAAPAADFSPVKDETFTLVFGQSMYAVAASMAAYLIAQFIDIRIFHFWKKLTKGKHLWLRNNFSTIPSQFIDTLVVMLVLCYFEVLKWDDFWLLFMNGFFFKVIIALCDTPFFYLATWWFHKKFGIRNFEEIEFIGDDSSSGKPVEIQE
jgi:queuosine precursor transporter